MAAIITDDFRKNNIENFVTDVSNSPALGGRNYYVGIGKTDPYPNQGASLTITELSNNFVPPPPNGSILEKEDVKRNLMTLVKIGENDIRRLIPQVEFRVGATYKVYDITDPTCFDKDADGTLPCYALYTDGDGLTKLYICLNNKNEAGEVVPTTTNIPTMPNPASGSVFPFGVQQNTTADNYIWTYIDYLNVDDTTNLFRDSQTFQTLTLDKDVDAKVNSVSIAPHTGIIDGRSRATRASAGLLYGFNILDGGNTLLDTGTTLTAKIVGERLDGNPIDENNSITLTVGENGEITKISWTLANAIDLGVSRASTIASTGATTATPTANPDNTIGNKGVKRASIVINDSKYTDKVGTTNFSKPNIQPLIAPEYGFGHSPLENLPSYYCGVSADFSGTVGSNSPGAPYIGEALVKVKFRQLSILRDSDSPYGNVRGAEDDSPGAGGGGNIGTYPDPTLAADKAVNCLPYFQISTNNTASVSEVPSAISELGGDGSYIEAVDVDASNEGEPARAWLDKVSDFSSTFPFDGNPNKSGLQAGGYRIYYHQNSDKRINKIPFDAGTAAGKSILIKDSAGTTLATVLYTDKRNGEYLRPNGEVMFVENRLPITRNLQQTEEVRIILQF